MTTTDWIIDIALILIVFRQLRETRMGPWTFLLPLAIMGWAGYQYLHGVPSAGNDTVLIAALTAVGVVFGLASGALTRVRRDGGRAYVRTTAGAAALWVISMGLRLAFAVWSSSAAGAADVARFSASHDITAAQAWVTALVLMAFGEVIARLAVLFVRGRLLPARASGPAPARA